MDKVVRGNISLRESVWVVLRRLGDGNVSAGVRKAVLLVAAEVKAGRYPAPRTIEEIESGKIDMEVGK